MDSGKVMTEVSGYRMSGSMVMGAGGSEVAGMGLPMTIDIQTEVQLSGGDIRQHMNMTTKGYQMEAYIIGDQYYQNTPGTGWVRMNIGTYKTQNMNMGLMDTQQLGLMAQMAENAEVIEEDGGKIGLSLHLGEGFFKASLEASRRYLEESGKSLPEDWMKTAEEAASGFQADMRIWLWQDSKLIDHIEMEYTMGGVPPLEKIESTAQLNMYDYNADIRIELPEEAKGAKEITYPTS
jgi:hypothetical protein